MQRCPVTIDAIVGREMMRVSARIVGGCRVQVEAHRLSASQDSLGDYDRGTKRQKQIETLVRRQLEISQTRHAAGAQGEPGVDGDCRDGLGG